MNLEPDLKTSARSAGPAEDRKPTTGHDQKRPVEGAVAKIEHVEE